MKTGSNEFDIGKNNEVISSFLNEFRHHHDENKRKELIIGLINKPHYGTEQLMAQLVAISEVPSV